jgi:hypothetical protein
MMLAQSPPITSLDATLASRVRIVKQLNCHCHFYNEPEEPLASPAGQTLRVVTRLWFRRAFSASDDDTEGGPSAHNLIGYADHNIPD